MKRTFLFIVVAILLLNYSCKDEDIEYPITYTGSVFSSYNTKVYSVDGEVVDTVSSDALAQARVQIPVPAGKQIVWMRLTKTTA